MHIHIKAAARALAAGALLLLAFSPARAADVEPSRVVAEYKDETIHVVLTSMPGDCKPYTNPHSKIEYSGHRFVVVSVKNGLLHGCWYDFGADQEEIGLEHTATGERLVADRAKFTFR